MRIKRFRNFNEGVDENSTLIIVDVQKSFKKFFGEMYLNKLNKYCKQFKEVYQIWDNHSMGKNVDKDYLYDNEPEIPIYDDLYKFPNQVKLIEKRYNYDVDVDFYKKILDKNIYNDIKQKENTKTIKKGDLFKTKEGTAIVYIGNRHKWFHVPKKLYELFLNLKGKNVVIVGGASSECLADVFITGVSMGLNIKEDHRYIYSASHCPIR
jgi:hypothetical protein